MYGCAGGGFGDGDLLKILEDEDERPSVGATVGMCLYFGIEMDSRRTISNDDAWEYFYELFSKMARMMTRESLYGFFKSDLFPQEVDEYLSHIKSMQRKTA